MAQLVVFIRVMFNGQYQGSLSHPFAFEREKKKNLPLRKFVSVTTDGAPAGSTSRQSSQCLTYNQCCGKLYSLFSIACVSHYVTSAAVNMEALFGMRRVCWLSHGKVLQRFIDLLTEITTFLKSGNENTR